MSGRKVRQVEYAVEFSPSSELEKYLDSFYRVRPPRHIIQAMGRAVLPAANYGLGSELDAYQLQLDADLPFDLSRRTIRLSGEPLIRRDLADDYVLYLPVHPAARPDMDELEAAMLRIPSSEANRERDPAWLQAHMARSALLADGAALRNAGRALTMRLSDKSPAALKVEKGHLVQRFT